MPYPNERARRLVQPSRLKWFYRRRQLWMPDGRGGWKPVSQKKEKRMTAAQKRRGRYIHLVKGYKPSARRKKVRRGGKLVETIASKPVIQAVRYKRWEWSSEEAREHSRKHFGSGHGFEDATIKSRKKPSRDNDDKLPQERKRRGT